MSFQAGIFYFDHREISESEAAAVRDWTRSSDCQPPASHRQPGMFLAHAALYPNRRGSFPGKNCAITFDGRLDNREDLLLRLRALPADASDAELALGAYETWGSEGLAHLIGDWSLVIADTKREEILLASDFAGVRPLYYRAEHNRVFWSTRLQPLVDWAQAGEIDDMYIAGLLLFGGCPNRTPYRGVYSVPPGHAVHVSADGARAGAFWSLPTQNQIRYSRESEYEEHLRFLLREAVQCRLPRHSASLCELSGGMDSSSVVATAAEMVRHGEVERDRVATLTFEHKGSVDQPFYTAVERACGLPSIHVSTATYPFLTKTEVGGAMPGFWRPLLRHTASIARQSGATTYLTGQLGDTVMGNWQDDSEQLSGLLRSGRIGPALRQALGWSKALRVPVAWVLWRGMLASLPPSLTRAGWYRPTMQAQTAHDTADSIAPGFRKRTGLSDPRKFFSEEWSQAPPERRKHFRELMQALELRRLQPPEPIEHLYWTHPYAHRPLVAFMLSIPADIVCRPGEPRRLMRRALRELWPPELSRRRSKDLFGGVFLDSLRPLAAELLTSDQPLLVVEAGYVERESLTKRLERLTMSLSSNEGQLRQIILLEYWLRLRQTPNDDGLPHLNLTTPVATPFECAVADSLGM